MLLAVLLLVFLPYRGIVASDTLHITAAKAGAGSSYRICCSPSMDCKIGTAVFGYGFVLGKNAGAGQADIQ